MFIWGRFRYDIVAVIALLAAVVAGLVPFNEAFSGFGHPATITVAVVLIVSTALSNSGAVDLLARYVSPSVKSHTFHIAILTALAAALSAVMNNIAALALLMPVAMESAEKTKRPTAIILMPLSFGSILGGMTTLIGTPPNIIVSTYRAKATGVPFNMFDFSPVGVIVAFVGIAFIAIAGWHLIPKQRRSRTSPSDLFSIDDYVTEALVPEDSKAIGKTLNEISDIAEENDALLIAIIRNGRKILATGFREKIKKGDFLVIEAGQKQIDIVTTELGLKLVGTEESKSNLLSSEDVAIAEVVISPGSRLEGHTRDSIRLKRKNINLLAVSRQGRSYLSQLKSFRFKAGDVLLLQGDADHLPEALSTLGCLPLAERKLKIGKRIHAKLSIGIFATAIIIATTGILPIHISFAIAAVFTVLFNIVPVRELYDSIDWSLIVLLGALIPIGAALEKTGATSLIVSGIITIISGKSPIFALLILMVATMTLSDVMNNTATAVVMSIIAIGLARRLDVNPDPLLMAVAVGASCAFLTPIGHQNNTLIMGPGGYKFTDYWRMGLPLELIIIAVSLPVIPWVWPL